MHYVYVLHSAKDGKLYTGATGDLRKRIEGHNNGKVDSTTKRRPFDLVYYEKRRCFQAREISKKW
jgi:putative endonuclease